MITRNDILKELKKNKNKDKENRKSEIEKFLKKEGLTTKKRWIDGHFTEVDEIKYILSDLDSYDI